MSHNLVERLTAQLAPLVPARSSILVGLSGGVDSVALLHLLHQLAPRFSWQLSALHVHHGISPNADSWVAFCAELCAGYDVPLQVEHVDIAPLREHGIEAAARKLRHAAFARQAADFVALAHHADDQAETLLLQLLRGAGVKGAAAMPVLSKVEWPLFAERADSEAAPFAVRPESVEGQRIAGSERASTGSARTESKNIRARSIVRPLLHFSRREILDYAAAQGLRWIEDESNADDSYPRNFLRHRVLPLLEEKFPACRDTLARSAQHFAEASELLDDLARLDAQTPSPLPSGEITSDLAVDVGQPSRMASSYIRARERGEGHGATLEVSRLQSLSLPRAKNLLRYFLHSLGAPMPQAAQLDDMLRQLCDARQDAAVCVAYGRGYDTLVEPTVQGSSRAAALPAPEGYALPCPGGYWEVRRYQGRVYALRALGEFDRNLVLPWQGEEEMALPQLGCVLNFVRSAGEGMSLEKLAAAPLTIRLRSGSETMRPHPNAATRTLKNLLQEHHVPPWRRERLPLLYCGEELACVPGVAVAAEYQAAKDEVGVTVNLCGA